MQKLYTRNTRKPPPYMWNLVTGNVRPSPPPPIKQPSIKQPYMSAIILLARLFGSVLRLPNNVITLTILKPIWKDIQNLNR